MTAKPDIPDTWWPLSTIATEIGVDPKTLANWSKKADSNGFPAPKETLGRYHLYDTEEVRRWLTLWSRVTRNMGNGGLNGQGR